MKFMYLIFFGILYVFNFVMDFSYYIGAAVRYIFFRVIRRKRSYHDLFIRLHLIR